MTKLSHEADIIVIGAGFGGLAAALRFSELGAKVIVLESLRYPGGCASTFSRNGFSFESGATLFSGFGEGQLFRRWIDSYELNVNVIWLDPVVQLRAPNLEIAIGKDRDALVADFMALPGAPKRSIHNFFELQNQVADVLWSLLRDVELLPPFKFSQLIRHALKFRDYFHLLPLVGKSLEEVLLAKGLKDYEPLRVYVDALSQITVQCSAKEAESLFALGAMDYFFRGTGHVVGGIGRLAHGLVDAIERNGGKVVFGSEVLQVQQRRGNWSVRSRVGEFCARTVVANVLPQNLLKLTGKKIGDLPSIDSLTRAVESGWGACMLYRVVRVPDEGSELPRHLELVRNPREKFVEGNHVFCSMNGEMDKGRSPDGYRTLTVSTHIPVQKLRDKNHVQQGEYVSSVQQTMRDTMSSLAPEWEHEILYEGTASPRTFERFTERYSGYVGGIPRRVGVHNYRYFKPLEVLPQLYLVGDTVFPGQSTFATAIGGYKLAEYLSD